MPSTWSLRYTLGVVSLLMVFISGDHDLIIYHDLTTSHHLYHGPLLHFTICCFWLLQQHPPSRPPTSAVTLPHSVLPSAAQVFLWKWTWARVTPSVQNVPVVSLFPWKSTAVCDLAPSSSTSSSSTVSTSFPMLTKSTAALGPGRLPSPLPRLLSPGPQSSTPHYLDHSEHLITFFKSIFHDSFKLLEKSGLLLPCKTIYALFLFIIFLTSIRMSGSQGQIFFPYRWSIGAWHRFWQTGRPQYLLNMWYLGLKKMEIYWKFLIETGNSPPWLPQLDIYYLEKLKRRFRIWDSWHRMDLNLKRGLKSKWKHVHNDDRALILDSNILKLLFKWLQDLYGHCKYVRYAHSYGTVINCYQPILSFSIRVAYSISLTNLRQLICHSYHEQWAKFESSCTFRRYLYFHYCDLQFLCSFFYWVFCLLAFKSSFTLRINTFLIYGFQVFFSAL